MKKINATIYAIVLNEEQHIKRMLESVKDFSEIIIVDSGSTDKTLDIARKYTNKIFYNKWDGEGSQKAYALSLCEHNWVLSLDADEEPDEKLRNEIIEIIETNNRSIDALDIKFSEYMMGYKVNDFVKKNTHIRFFNKLTASYNTTGTHAQIKSNGIIAKSRGSIHHFSLKPLEVLVEKNNRYSSWRASEKNIENKKPSLIKLMLIFPLVFFKSYILRRNIFNGKRGFISSMTNAFYAFLKEAKLFELTFKN